MSSLLETLRAFERKERFAILTAAIGFNPDKILLDASFRRKLEECVEQSIPTRVFLAMDYHLDWLEIALLVHGTESPPQSAFPHERAREINSNQQDIDLLLAFELEDHAGNTISHLVLIEAKAFSSWNNEQLIAKAGRLRKIFGNDGTRHQFVQPHFVLMSSRDIKSVITTEWPNFMLNDGSIRILNYRLPERLKITRSDREGRNDIDGGHLRLDEVR